LGARTTKRRQYMREKDNAQTNIGMFDNLDKEKGLKKRHRPTRIMKVIHTHIHFDHNKER